MNSAQRRRSGRSGISVGNATKTALQASQAALQLAEAQVARLTKEMADIRDVHADRLTMVQCQANHAEQLLHDREVDVIRLEADRKAGMGPLLERIAAEARRAEYAESTISELVKRVQNLEAELTTNRAASEQEYAAYAKQVLLLEKRLAALQEESVDKLRRRLHERGQELESAYAEVNRLKVEVADLRSGQVQAKTAVRPFLRADKAPSP